MSKRMAWASVWASAMSAGWGLRRRVYYLTTAGCKRPLPHFRLGSQIAARRSTILAWIEQQEALRHGR